ncbi:hypothetical protein BY458DRAFT_495460 [Sporodiniella umbellata]|nr:hypothetical protein BY458DRAFT_495460 [Sporodiniella umbellata]
MYPSIKDNNIQNKLFEKQEFLELKNNIKYNYEYKTLDKHQEFVRRFISPVTNYERLMLLHGTGTGKTFASVSVAETHRKNCSIKRCLVLVKGMVIVKNDKFYEFDRFIKFSRKLANMSDEHIIEKYKYSKVLFLTATPMVDRSSEIFPLISLLSKKEIKSFEDIKTEVNGIISYCDATFRLN